MHINVIVYSTNLYAVNIFHIHIYTTCVIHISVIVKVFVLMWLLIETVSFPEKSQNGLTPLMSATMNRHVDVVRMLIQAKANINAQDEVSCCIDLLEYTIYTSWCTVVNWTFHITMGFCPQEGWTALHMAAWEGEVSTLRLLTEARVHVNIQTEVHALCHIGSILTSSCICMKSCVVVLIVYRH